LKYVCEINIAQQDFTILTRDEVLCTKRNNMAYDTQKSHECSKKCNYPYSMYTRVPEVQEDGKT